MKYALGIDLGGTNIKALAVTPSGRVLRELTRPTEDQGDQAWQQSVRRVFNAVQAAMGAPATWIGLAAPGLASAGQRCIAYMPGRLSGLEGLTWADYFQTKTEVPVLNDAQAALLGESWLGAARAKRNALLLTLGTGVGGAAMVDGHLLRGEIGRAGHFGHMSLDPHGKPDITGTPGSLEDAIGDSTLHERSSGRFTSSKRLVRAVRNGDRGARAIWEESVRGLAAGIASLINILDPAVVVIGGGIAQAGPDLFRPLKCHLAVFEWRPGGHKARVVPARLGDRAGAFGAARQALLFQPT